MPPKIYPSLQQYQNYTFDDLIDPVFLYYTRWFLDLVFLWSFTSYIFAVYVIFTKSTPLMGMYKYTVTLQLTGNIFFDFYLFFMNPTFAFPTVAIINNTHFPINPKHIWYYAIIILFGSIVITAVAIVLALTVRVFAVANIDLLTNHRYKSLALLFFPVMGILAFSSISVPFFTMARDYHYVREAYEANIPAMIEIFEVYPVTAAILFEETSNNLTIWFGVVFFWLVVMGSLILSLHFIFISRLREFRKIVSGETYEMQRMLHKSVIIQLFNVGFLAAIPICIASGTFLFDIPFINPYRKYIANIAPPIASCHVVVDIICLMYFVKPYRRYCLSLISKFGIPFNFKLKTVAVEPSTMISRDQGSLHVQSIQIRIR